MIAHHNFLKDIGRILFWFPVRWCIGLLPFSAVYYLGSFLGDCDFILSGRNKRQKIYTHMLSALGLGQKETKKLVRENFRNHAQNVLELIKYPQLNPENISSLVDFEGIDYLDQELQKPAGVILLTAHFGAKQVLQVGLGHRGYRVNQIHYHMGRDELTWIQKYISQMQRVKIERRIPVHFIPAAGFMGSAYKCLKRNEILIIAGDGIGIKQHMNDSYKAFEFLGEKMLFPTGTIELAQRTGASVVLAFAIRQGDRHRIVFEPPICVTGREPVDCVKEYVHIMQRYVRNYPWQWEFWEEFEKGVLIDAGQE